MKLKFTLSIILSFLIFAHCNESNLNQINLASVNKTCNDVVKSDQSITIVKAIANLVPEPTPLPPTFNTLLQGYTFISNVDDPNKDYKIKDRFESFEVALLIYKSIKENEVGRIALDLRDFAWKCGPRRLCPMEELYTKVTQKEIDLNAFKSQFSTFSSKIGANQKKCVGDLYTHKNQKHIISFCLDSDSDVSLFNLLFSNLNDNDFIGAGNINIQDEKTYSLFFSDGHNAIISQSVTFKIDGLYLANKLWFKYEAMENFEGLKCNILNNLPIVPIKFLEKNILNPKCVLKFKYNKLDTYIGNPEKKCEEIMSYVQNKMKGSCLRDKNGSNDQFANDLKYDSIHGLWTGWIYYHRIGFPLENHMFKAIVTPQKFEIYNNQTQLIHTIFYDKLNWDCNNDGDCNIEEYINHLTKTQNSKLNEFTKISTSYVKTWNLQDYNLCFVIEEVETHVVCPQDYSEEYSLRKAFSYAIDLSLVDAQANIFLARNTTYNFDILYSRDSEPIFKDYNVKLTSEALFEGQNKLVDLKNIKTLNNIKCGFEFRLLSKPLEYHELQDQCCTRFFTTENNWMCLQQQSKCYIKLRRIIQDMRKSCLALQTEEKPSIPSLPINNITPTNVTIQTGVIIMELDNYKYKGEVEYMKANIEVNNDIVFKVNDTFSIKLPILSINLLCNSPLPCTLDEYEKTQEPYLEKNADLEWQQSSISKFLSENPKISKKDCMVVISEDSFFQTFRMILSCSIEPGQGHQMRRELMKKLSEQLAQLKGTNEELEKLPSVPNNAQFKVEIASVTNESNLKLDTQQSSGTIIKVSTEGIMYLASGQYVIKYNQLVNEEMLINMELNVLPERIPKSILDKKINPRCCFKMTTTAGNLSFICTVHKCKCIYEKVVLFNSIRKRSLDGYYETISKINRKKNILNLPVEDPFDFGLTPKYKKFEPGFNIDLLQSDTFDFSQNGIWEGWVYENAVTERNFNKKVTPVFCQIGDGKIIFKTDESQAKAYKVLHLHQYEQRCDNHCKPDEYIKDMINNQISFDDIMYLQKAVDNVLGELKMPYINEGCVLLDFMNAIYQFGHSEIICSIDKGQGNNIREAIDKSYYNRLLRLDMETEVRKPHLNSEFYYASLFINGKHNPDFDIFTLTENGISGMKKNKLNKWDPKLDTKYFNLTYSEISNDNFGTECAFWYKNMKCKKQGFEKIVKDNNCCFKFHTKKDKTKIEFCVESIGVCIKDARELMKGLKHGCEQQFKYSVDTDTKNDGVIDDVIDPYKSKTIDDHKNGIFKGFIYVGSVNQPSQTPQNNPTYIDIGGDNISFYLDNKKLEKPSFTIALTDLTFACKMGLCTIDEYLLYVQSTINLMAGINEVKTVINLFKDFYNYGNDINKRCFVLTSKLYDMIICSYLPEHLPPIIQSIINSYTKYHMNLKLFSIPDPDISTTYSVEITNNTGKIASIVKVDTKGLIDIHSNNVLINYRNIQNDPISNNRCAIWYHELVFDNAHPECCFAFSIENNLSTICVVELKVCIGDTYKLMKAIYNGCMYDSPNQNKLDPSPDSEILGQESWNPKKPFDPLHNKVDICPKDRKNVIFDSNTLIQDHHIDIFNEIAYSLQKTSYKGWFNIYPIEFNSEPPVPLYHYYGELTPESFKFYKTQHESSNKTEPNLVIRPDVLSISCGDKVCLPKGFIQKIVNADKNLEYLQKSFRSKFDSFERRRDEGCGVLENMVDNKPSYLIICAHIMRTRSPINEIQAKIDSSDYSSSRILLSNFYGNIIRQIVKDSYNISRKYTTNQNLPNHPTPIKTVKMTTATKTTVYSSVVINNDGIVSNELTVLKFNEIGNCSVKFNLLYVPDSLMFNGKRECCIRFYGAQNWEYACVDDFHCEYSTYRLAKNFYDKCKAAKNVKDSFITNELNTGNNVSIIPLIKHVFKSEIKITNDELVKLSLISQAEFIVKHRTIVINNLYKIKDLMHDFNNIQITSSIKTNADKIDITPPDIWTIPNEIKPLYSGENENYKFSVNSGRINVISHKKNFDKLTVINNIQYIKTKDFNAIIADKSTKILLIYKDNNKNLFVQIGKNVLLTDDSTKLCANLKDPIELAKLGDISLN